jgi:stage V sporulation protein B
MGADQGGRDNSFLTGAFLLAASSAFSRLLGATVRIPLARVMGDEGIGLYQMAYPIYSVMLALSTTGINIAVSKLVAEKVAQGRWRTASRIFRQAMQMLLVLGLVSAVALALLARPISQHLVRDPRAYLAIVAVSPALLLVALMAALRGLFQGLQDMGPTAWSQVVEQMIRVTTMFTLGLWLLPRGLEWAAAGAVFGAVTGAVAGLAYLGRRYMLASETLRRRARAAKDDTLETSGQVLRQILNVAVPISLASIIMPLMQFIDMAIVPARLQAQGYSYQVATGLYGQLSGMAYPLIYVPTIFTAALTMSLVPAVSEAQVRHPGWVRSRTRLAVRLNMLVNMPAAVGLAVLATDISALLYREPAAGVPLLWLAPATVFLSVQMISGGILQGLGRSDLPVKHLLIGGAVKLVLTYLLAGTVLGTRGAALATVIGFAVNGYLNSRAAARLQQRSLETLRLTILPGVASAAMAIAVWYTRAAVGRYASSTRATLAAIMVGIVVYGGLMLMTGGITIGDLQMIPFVGPLFSRVFERLGYRRR